MTGGSRFTAALQALSAALDEVGARWMIIGGLAVIARGVLRHTTDADIALWAPGLSIDRVLTVAAAHEIVPRSPDIRTLAAEAQILLLTHTPSSVDADVSLAWLPFEDEALATATAVDFGGVTLPTARAEDLIIYKAVAWRERDRSDIERLVVRHRNDIDFNRVRNHVRHLATLMEQPERAVEFDRFVTGIAP
jgi:predicted nucleotidyltransferase